MLKLQYYRAKAGLTIRELASIEYVKNEFPLRKVSNPTTISKIETGKIKKPSLNTLIRISEVLGERVGEKINPLELLENY